MPDENSTAPSPASSPTSSGGSDLGSTTPSSLSEPASTPSSESSAPSFDFDSIFGDFGGEDSPSPQVGTSEASEASPPVPAEPVATPVATPMGAEPAAQTQPESQPAQPQVPPASESGAQSAPAQAPAQLDFSDPGQLAEALLKNRAEVETHVAKQLFTLTPEEIEALETDVVGTVPKLLAKAYVASQTAIMQQLSRIVPAMMQRQLASNKKYEENSSKFFARWPQLDPAKHGDVVYRAGVVYRQMNPRATLDQMIADLGPIVLHAAGLPLGPQAPQVPAPTSRQAPFTPAHTSVVGIPQPTPQNDFAYMQETGED